MKKSSKCDGVYRPGRLRRATAWFEDHPQVARVAASRAAAIDASFYLIPWSGIPCHVIRSFRDKDTEKLFQRTPVRRWQDIERVARRKLEQLNAAPRLDDLRIPPGNRLGALKGDRRGQHSICVNDRWRVCFVWKDGGAYDVEIVDYH